METGSVVIFGKEYQVVARKAKYEKVVRSRKKIYVYYKCSQDPEKLLDRYLRSLLYRYTLTVLEHLGKRGYLNGALKIKVVNDVTKAHTVLARIRGNFVEISAYLVQFPKQIIRYVLVHELAHLFVRKHTEKFHTILNTLLPDAKKIEEKFPEYMSIIQSNYRTLGGW